MKLTAKLAGAIVASAVALAAPARAEVKVALDTAPDLAQSGTYVWAHTFASYLNDHGMEAEEFERGALGGWTRSARGFWRCPCPT